MWKSISVIVGLLLSAGACHAIPEEGAVVCLTNDTKMFKTLRIERLVVRTPLGWQVVDVQGVSHVIPVDGAPWTVTREWYATPGVQYKYWWTTTAEGACHWYNVEFDDKSAP